MPSDITHPPLLFSLPILNGFIESLNDPVESTRGRGFSSLLLYRFPTNGINPSTPNRCCLAEFFQFSFLLSLDLLQLHPMFLLHFMFGEIPCDPGPTHWVDVRIKDDRIKMPNNNREGSQNRLIKMNRPGHVPTPHGKELKPFCLKPEDEPCNRHDDRPPDQA